MFHTDINPHIWDTGRTYTHYSAISRRHRLHGSTCKCRSCTSCCSSWDMLLRDPRFLVGNVWLGKCGSHYIAGSGIVSTSGLRDGHKCRIFCRVDSLWSVFFCGWGTAYMLIIFNGFWVLASFLPLFSVHWFLFSSLLNTLLIHFSGYRCLNYPLSLIPYNDAWQLAKFSIVPLPVAPKRQSNAHMHILPVHKQPFALWELSRLRQ